MTNESLAGAGLYRHLVEHLSTAVLMLDGELKIQYLNPAAEMLLSTSLARARGMALPECFMDDPEAGRAFSRCIREGHSFTRREAALMVIPGKEVVVDYTVSPLHRPGAHAGLLIEMQQLDRMLRITREEGLLHAREATRALVRGVAHELKNPLGGIRGAAQLLDRALPGDELSEYTRVIIDEADRLRTLADRMLGPRRLPRFEQVNVHECLEHVRHLAVAEQDRTVAIVRDYDPSLPEVRADRDQIIQVLLNLVRNAIQAMVEADTPEPELILRTRALRQFTIGSRRHRLVARIDVQDCGPGISEELRETLFYPMVSGRPNGSGLGLSIAQSIVSQHQGLLECHSKPGGTVFTLLLPMEHDESGQQAEAS